MKAVVYKEIILMILEDVAARAGFSLTSTEAKQSFLKLVAANLVAFLSKNPADVTFGVCKDATIKVFLRNYYQIVTYTWPELEVEVLRFDNSGKHLIISSKPDDLHSMADFNAFEMEIDEYVKTITNSPILTNEEKAKKVLNFVNSKNIAEKSGFPSPALSNILSYLGLHDLYNAGLVSKFWHKSSKSDLIWLPKTRVYISASHDSVSGSYGYFVRCYSTQYRPGLSRGALRLIDLIHSGNLESVKNSTDLKCLFETASTASAKINPLHHAMKCESYEVREYIYNYIKEIKFENEERLDRQDSQYETLFSYAVKFNLQDEVKKYSLFASQYVNAKNLHNKDLLTEYIRLHHKKPNFEEMLDFLITCGADLFASDVGSAFEQGLVYAPSSMIKIVATILDNGQELNKNILTITARVGSLELIKFLRSRKIPINLLGTNKKTPLQTAVNNGHTEIVRYFYSLGYRLDVIDENLAKHYPQNELLDISNESWFEKNLHRDIKALVQTHSYNKDAQKARFQCLIKLSSNPAEQAVAFLNDYVNPQTLTIYHQKKRTFLLPLIALLNKNKEEWDSKKVQKTLSEFFAENPIEVLSNRETNLLQNMIEFLQIELTPSVCSSMQLR